MPVLSNIETTMRIDYSDEFHTDYQRMQTILKQGCKARSLPGAKTIAFDTAGLTGRAKQRQRDGQLPYGRPDTGQVTKDITEFFEPYIIDDFDLFRNNSQVRNNMMVQAIGVCNREVDAQIIEELDTATQEVSASAVAFSSLGTFLDWQTTLFNNDIPSSDGKLWCVLTPAAYAQMMRINEFKSADFVDVKPFVEGAPSIGVAKYWMGCKFLRHTGLTGFNTATASCYMWHEDALGHADDGAPKFVAGMDEKHDQHYCYARVRQAAKLVLPRGVVRAIHDDTAAFA